jgi:hypothetical protein
VLHEKDEILIVALYVDDLVISGSNIDLILGMKKQLENTFEMAKFGLLHFFLGIQILHMDDSIFTSQPKCVIDILHRLNMEYCKPYTTPFQSRTKEYDSPKVGMTLYRQLVGRLIYLIHSQPNISFVIIVVSWFKNYS